MKRLRKCVFAAGFFLSMSLMVFGESAEAGDKMFSVGPRITYSTPEDADEGKWSVGAQGRLHLASILALEGSIDYRSNEYSDIVIIRTYPVQASLLAYVVPKTAFLIGGVGWYYTRVEEELFDTSFTTNRFGVHAGAGLEIRMSESLSVDGTYRYIWLEEVESKDENAMDKEYKDSGTMVTVALNMFF